MTSKHKYHFYPILTVLFILTLTTASGQVGSRSFNFNQISETEYRNALHNNFNAIPLRTIDSSRQEKALQLIDKTYSQHEIDLAKSELYESPRCLTSFYGYYPDLDILVFLIQDTHFENAIFLKDSEGFPNKWIDRFNGSYGVMSKSGLWIGLERQDCDNYLQIEICEITNRGTWTILRFDFKTIDINADEKEPILWVNESTIYLATIEYNNMEKMGQKKFYEIKFEY